MWHGSVKDCKTNLHYPKMHLSKFYNEGSRDSPRELEDSQKFSKVKMSQNEHEWNGFHQEPIIRLRQIDI